MSKSNTGGVDLEAVLNVGRRTLVSIGETAGSVPQSHYTDTIYLKREDYSNSPLTIDSRIVIFGELQLLFSIFERYTSNIIFNEELSADNNSSPLSSKRQSFEILPEEEEQEDREGLPIISTMRRSSKSSSKGSASPTRRSESPTGTSGSAIQRKQLGAVGRKQTTSSTASDYSITNLDGKHYGCIELPSMQTIEIFEVILRCGLDLVDVSSDYDRNILHQSFVFSKIRQAPQRTGQHQSRTTSFNSS